MKQIKTSRKKTYPVDYCGIGYSGMLKMQIKDSRPIGKIAPEFEDLDSIEYTDNTDEPELFEGFAKIKRMEYIDPESVVIILMNPDTEQDDVF